MIDLVDNNLLISVVQITLIGLYIAYLVRWGMKVIKYDLPPSPRMVSGAVIRIAVLILLSAVLFNGVDIGHRETEITLDDSYQEVIDESPTMEQIHQKDMMRENRLMNEAVGPSLEEEEKRNQHKIDSVLNSFM